MDNLMLEIMADIEHLITISQLKKDFEKDGPAFIKQAKEAEEICAKIKDQIQILIRSYALEAVLKEKRKNLGLED
jgi:hypothetical protein